MIKRIVNLTVIGLVLCLLLLGTKIPNILMLVGALAGGLVIGLTLVHLPTEAQRKGVAYTFAILLLFTGVIGGGLTIISGNPLLLYLALGLFVGIPLGAGYGWVAPIEQTPSR